MLVFRRRQDQLDETVSQRGKRPKNKKTIKKTHTKTNAKTNRNTKTNLKKQIQRSIGRISNSAKAKSQKTLIWSLRRCSIFGSLIHNNVIFWTFDRWALNLHQYPLHCSMVFWN